MRRPSSMFPLPQQRLEPPRHRGWAAFTSSTGWTVRLCYSGGEREEERWEEKSRGRVARRSCAVGESSLLPVRRPEWTSAPKLLLHIMARPWAVVSAACDMRFEFSSPPSRRSSSHTSRSGRLIAVGVVDVLPRCLSSKYLFWDTGVRGGRTEQRMGTWDAMAVALWMGYRCPRTVQVDDGDEMFPSEGLVVVPHPALPRQPTLLADLGPLSLGRLSSLLEIDWVKEASTTCPALHYYYLGFYLQTCHRMRYKVRRERWAGEGVVLPTEA